MTMAPHELQNPAVEFYVTNMWLDDPFQIKFPTYSQWPLCAIDIDMVVMVDGEELAAGWLGRDDYGRRLNVAFEDNKFTGLHTFNFKANLNGLPDVGVFDNSNPIATVKIIDSCLTTKFSAEDPFLYDMTYALGTEDPLVQVINPVLDTVCGARFERCCGPRRLTMSLQEPTRSHVTFANASTVGYNESIFFSKIV